MAAGLFGAEKHYAFRAGMRPLNLRRFVRIKRGVPESQAPSIYPRVVCSGVGFEAWGLMMRRWQALKRR